MDARELRLGNYFQWSELGSMGISIIESGLDLTDYMDLKEPIQLTEEWLVKFGFENPADSWIGSIFHLSEWDDFPLNWCVALNKNNAILVCKLEYVHSLQNLYFALTGQELELK